MQLSLALYGDGIKLPQESHRALHGLIYHALSCDPLYSAALHAGSSGTERSYKGFTFGPLYGNISACGSGQYLNGYAVVEIRSCDEEMITLLYRHFTACGEVRLGSSYAEVAEVNVTNRKPGLTQADVELIAPAVAYITDDTRHTVFFSPDDEQFYKSLQSNAAGKARRFLRRTEELQIIPLFRELPRKEFVVFKGTYINAWYGRYRLKGSSELIDLLYDVGIGAKNSEGFGMFELIQNG